MGEKLSDRETMCVYIQAYILKVYCHPEFMRARPSIVLGTQKTLINIHGKKVMQQYLLNEGDSNERLIVHFHF